MKKKSEINKALPKSVLAKLAEYEYQARHGQDKLPSLLDEKPPFQELSGESLGREIKRRRKLQKLSELALADLAGVSRSTIQKIESANMNVTLDSIMSVMKAVGMELVWR